MLEDDYRRRTLFGRFYPQPEWTDDGLMLGAGTCLLRSYEDPAAETGERLLAILSAIGPRDVDRAVLGHVDASRRHWRRGDNALAQLRLVYAGLPTVDARGGFHAFLADRVLACGLSPAVLRKELGFGGRVAARKYSDAQPRVPAGSGAESGRWTAGDDAPVVEGRSVDSGASIRTAFLDDRRKADAETRGEDKAKETFGAETIENEIAQGRPIPLLPTGPFGAPLPSAVTAGPKPEAVPDASASGGNAKPPGREPPNDDRSRLCPEPEKDRGEKNEFARLYQEFVGSKVNPDGPRVPSTMAYWFPVPGISDVAIDHCDEKTGKLVEAKGHYYEEQNWDFMKDHFEEDWLTQAKRQTAVAQAYGRRLEWWFNEEEAMNAADELFKRHKIQGIDLKHVEYPGDAEWPYPPNARWARRRRKP